MLTKSLALLIENNQIITASHITISTFKMAMNERFNMTGLSRG